MSRSRPNTVLTQEFSTSEAIELIRLNTEYLKYLTTLSTGAVLLQFAFLEKVFSHPRWKWLIVVSLVSFVLSIVSAVLTYTMSIGGTSPLPELHGQHAAKIASWGMLCTWIGFLLGIVTLAVFAIRNILVL